MRRVFIVLVYKKRVRVIVPMGLLHKACVWTQATRLMLGKHKTAAYVEISELEDYGTMPADPATSNCDLRNVQEYSSVMSLMLVGNVTCCFASKVDLLYLL